MPGAETSHERDARRTLLLVEDEALIAMQEARELESRGYAVTIAHNAERAIGVGSSDTIDLILMDIDLGAGQTDGAAAARAILAKRDVPIVFLSSHTESEVVDRTESIASYGYVVKSSPITTLDASIKMALRLFDAKTRLRDSEEKYRAAFLTSPDAVNINRLDGLYVDVNEGFMALTGYSRDEVVGKLSADIDIWAIPKDRQRLVDGLRTTGVVENLRSDFRCKDGSIKTALMSARLIRMGGEPHILSVTRDITAQIAIDAELQLRDRKYAAIFETAADGILIGDERGAITDANASLARLSGYARDELIGRPIDILFDEVTLRETPLDYDAIGLGQMVRAERLLRTKNGDQIPVVMHSTQVEPGCLQSIFHDVSVLRRTEAALRTSEERFRLATEGSADGLWDWNLQTDEAFHSQRFETMLGYEPGELPNTADAWRGLLHPEDLQSAMARVRAYLAGETDGYTSTFRMRTKDGSYRWIRGRGKAVFDTDGRPTRFVGFNTDITEDERQR